MEKHLDDKPDEIKTDEVGGSGDSEVVAKKDPSEKLDILDAEPVDKVGDEALEKCEESEITSPTDKEESASENEVEGSQDGSSSQDFKQNQLLSTDTEKGGSHESHTMELYRSSDQDTSSSTSISTFDPFSTSSVRPPSSLHSSPSSLESVARTAADLHPPDPALPKGPRETDQSIVP